MTQGQKENWSGILIYLEVQQNNLHPVGLELIGKAIAMLQNRKEKINGIIIGENLEKLQNQLNGLPLEQVFFYSVSGGFQADIYEEALEDCISKIQPSVVLIGGTLEGRSLAPRAAVHFHTGLTADCTELILRDSMELLQIRPAFGGNLMAGIVTRDTRPQFATVRPNVMLPISSVPGIKPKIQKTEWKTKKAKFPIIIRKKVGQAGITEQKILVVAGRGVRKKEDLAMMEEFAYLIGGTLASSRALVEKGFFDAEKQIGLSGNTVRPEYMITCGVSGTVQFMAGMRQTKNIIAINTDPNAKIFDVAHYPICGDLYEIIPQLIKKMKEKKK